MTPQSKSRWRRSVAAIVWTLALLLLTNVFWSAWGGMDIDHPSALVQLNNRECVLTSDSYAIAIEEKVLATRTAYAAYAGTAAVIEQKFGSPGLTSIAVVTPRWMQRHYSDSLLAGATDPVVRGSFESVGWPVRLLWCGSEVTDGKTRHAVPFSGIKVREPRKFKGKLDGVMPTRPILLGELFYGGIWLAVVMVVPMGWRRLKALLDECGPDRAGRRQALRQLTLDLKSGRWLTWRTMRIASIVLVVGLITNLAVAWSCAAWVKPVGKTSIAQMTSLGDGQYEGESRLDRFGRTVIFRGRSSKASFWPDGTLEYALWDFDAEHGAEIQAGWPMRSWACRNPGYHEMRTFTGISIFGSVGLGTPTVGGIDLAPFKLAGPSNQARVWRALPYQPLWGGLVADTLFYPALFGLLFLLPRWVRREIRRRRGQCAACGYPIGSSPVCTECGAAVVAPSG